MRSQRIFDGHVSQSEIYLNSFEDFSASYKEKCFSHILLRGPKGLRRDRPRPDATLVTWSDWKARSSCNCLGYFQGGSCRAEWAVPVPRDAGRDG